MGIKFILPLIAGIVMTVILGTQVAPSLIENIKIAKVENSTISNQNLIKDAIIKYIKLEGKAPIDLKELQDSKILKDYHESNIFGGNYDFTIDKKKGILKIFTTINDTKAEKYFSNSSKFPNKPICIEFDQNGACTGKFQTFYLLDENTLKSILPPIKVGSIKDIQNRFTKNNIGKKKDKDGEEVVFVDSDKDYVVDITKNEVTEYVYDEVNGWEEGTTIKNIGGFGIETNVFISDLEWSFFDGLGEEIKQKHEKVHCKGTTLLEKEVFVINENTGLGEIVWVAPTKKSVSEIQTKIFDEGFTPNNICTSKVTGMEELFYGAEEFDQPLDRWDVSKVTNMYYMFKDATSFNQDISNWNVSNVESMWGMFSYATNFNNGGQPLDWGESVSKVYSMVEMFYNASNFNQDISSWKVGNVKYMSGMFGYASNFNQDLSGWCVENLSEPYHFNIDTPAWIPKSNRVPKWGVTCP